MESGKTPRMEELESGQQEMQEKISRATKMVINLTNGKRITDDPGEPTPWKGGIDPSIVPNIDNPCEQESFKKNSSRWLNHVDMQQRCSLLDKKLKEIEGVNDLESVDPRKLCLVPNLVIPPNFKIPNLKSTMEPNALRIIWPHIVTRWWDTPVMKIY